MFLFEEIKTNIDESYFNPDISVLELKVFSESSYGKIITETMDSMLNKFVEIKGNSEALKALSEGAFKNFIDKMLEYLKQFWRKVSEFLDKYWGTHLSRHTEAMKKVEDFIKQYNDNNSWAAQMFGGNKTMTIAITYHKKYGDTFSKLENCVDASIHDIQNNFNSMVGIFHKKKIDEIISMSDSECESFTEEIDQKLVPDLDRLKNSVLSDSHEVNYFKEELPLNGQNLVALRKITKDGIKLSDYIKFIKNECNKLFNDTTGLLERIKNKPDISSAQQSLISKLVHILNLVTNIMLDLIKSHATFYGRVESSIVAGVNYVTRMHSRTPDEDEKAKAEYAKNNRR